MSVQGNIKPVRSLVEPLQVAMDNGAKRALIPIENKRNFLDVTADVLEHVDPIFYGDPKTAGHEGARAVMTTGNGRRRSRLSPHETRNAEIERLYRDEGRTLEEIGVVYNMTRERARQILKKRGADDATGSLAVRRSRRADAAAEATAAFDEEHGPTLRRLIDGHVPPSEIASRLTILGKGLSEQVIRDFADRHGLPLAAASTQRFSPSILRLAVLAAAGDRAGVESKANDATLVESEALAALSAVSTTSEEVATLAGLAVQARHAPDPLSLTKNDYESWRDRWLERFPKAGNVPWPPTSQTIMKRLGGGFWNEAARDAGLTANTQGRTRGAIFYTGAAEYEDALASFFADCAAAGRSPTVAEYDRWRKGRVVPTSAAVRNKYRTWTAAKLMVQSRVGVPAARPRGPRNLATDQLIDQLVLQLQRELVDAEGRILALSSPAAVASAVKEEADQTLGDLVTSFETFRRRWIFAAVREDPSAFLDKVSDRGDGTKSEKRTWAALGGDARDAAEAVIASRGLDALLSATEGDLQNDGGWLGYAQRARLERIDPSDSFRWRVLKAARNSVEHESKGALDVLEVALREVQDANLTVAHSPNSPANVLRWVTADVGPPPGYPAGRLSRSRLAHLHALVIRVASLMRSG